jgi:hypothetical protein
MPVAGIAAVRLRDRPVLCRTVGGRSRLETLVSKTKSLSINSRPSLFASCRPPSPIDTSAQRGQAEENKNIPSPKVSSGSAPATIAVTDKARLSSVEP